MKKFSFLLAGFILNLIFSLQIAAQSNFLRSFNWPEITEATMDSAYEAAASKLYGKWIQGYESEILTLNSNGTFELQQVHSYSMEGIKIMEIYKGNWKKEKDLLRLQFSKKRINKIAQESLRDYNNLSTRKKDQVQEYLNQYTECYKDTEYYYIKYLSSEVLCLKTYDYKYFLSAAKFNQLEKEAEAKEAKEKAEKLAAQQKVEEEKISRGNNKTNEEIFITVEQPAEFPGGQSALMKWLSNNMHYPEAAKQNDIQGRVIVTFVVEKDGTIGDAKVSRSVDPDLDREALRLVKKMPAWQPGKNEGVAVASYFNLPITFRLQ